MILQNKVIIVSKGLDNQEIVKVLSDSGMKVASWDLLNPQYWETPMGFAFFMSQEVLNKKIRLFWVDIYDKDAVQLGLRRVEDTLGLPEFVMLPIKEFKKLIGV